MSIVGGADFCRGHNLRDTDNPLSDWMVPHCIKSVLRRFILTIEHNKFVAELLIDLFNGGNLDAADGLVTDNYVWHDASQRRELGLEGFKQRVRSLRKSLSGYHATIDDLLADGDKVIARYSGQGTHNGSFLGIAPTGRLVTYSAILIWRLVEGKVAEEWTSWDALGVLHQLGAVPLALSLSTQPLAANS
jgi:steroid delta-isomerase-like uncharacterized protein